MTFTWKDGRKLTSAVLDENRTVDLEYNQEGMLVKKTLIDDDVTEVTEYFYASGVLQAMRETWLYEGEEFEEHFLWFLYDETGDIIGFRKDNVTYYYSKNLQGDVLAILSRTNRAFAVQD